MVRRPARPQQLRLRASSQVKACCSNAFCALPKLIGSPIDISLQPQLTAFRGKLLSGSVEKGTAVHAASFIRSRRVVLETELVTQQRLLRRILVHELFHFVWPRLGNPVRNSFADLLAAERKARVRGEVGESAQIRKDSLRIGDNGKSRRWREYVCESFCDTAAWLHAGKPLARHCMLPKRYRDRRQAWFEVSLRQDCYC